MTYATIEEGESTPLQNGGGYSSADRTTAAATPRTKHTRTSAGLLRAMMVGTTVGALLLMAGPSKMGTMNKSSNVDGMVVVSSWHLGTDCAPATGTFSGLSCKDMAGYCAGPHGVWEEPGVAKHIRHFETCYVSNNAPPNDRCWSRSHTYTVPWVHSSLPHQRRVLTKGDLPSYRCNPDGYIDGNSGYKEWGIWHVSVPFSDGSCGNPCQKFDDRKK